VEDRALLRRQGSFDRQYSSFSKTVPWLSSLQYAQISFENFQTKSQKIFCRNRNDNNDNNDDNDSNDNNGNNDNNHNNRGAGLWEFKKNR